MEAVSIQHDLGLLVQQHPGIQCLVDRLQGDRIDDACRMELLARIGAAANIGAYRSLGLLLKGDWQVGEARSTTCCETPGRWRPWTDAARFARHLPPEDASAGEVDVELLLLEQCALSCHLIGLAEVAALAARHLRLAEILAEAPVSERQSFTDDKCQWLRDELQIDELLDLRQQLVAELECTRMQYLSIIGTVVIELVEAAQLLALMRYRLALNDPTMTVDELNHRLLEDLELPEGEHSAVHLEPELRLALRDTAQRLRGDHQALCRIAELWTHGKARPASQEDQRTAARLFRKLARMLHPDALQQHKDYPAISLENRRRLADIWYAASATHGTRIHLSQDKLLNYLKHLQEWIVEVERILRHLSFHAPSRLIAGDTLEEMHVDLRQAMLDAQRCLHAVRGDIAALEFDPQHAEYRRVIALDADGRLAERARIAALTERWNQVSDELEVQLASRVSDAASADAAQMRGAQS